MLLPSAVLLGNWVIPQLSHVRVQAPMTNSWLTTPTPSIVDFWACGRAKTTLPTKDTLPTDAPYMDQRLQDGHHFHGHVHVCVHGNTTSPCCYH